MRHEVGLSAAKGGGPRQGPAASLLTLSGFLQQFRREHRGSSTLSELWSQLNGPRKVEVAIELNARARAQLLPLSQEAARAVDGLVTAGDVATVRDLLPLVRGVSPAATPTLNRLTFINDETVRRYADLLLAEANGPNEATLPVLVYWLGAIDEPDDRARFRAAVALHGENTGYPLLRVTRLGPQTLEEVARLRSENCATNPQSALPLTWFFERVEHDDPAALAAWFNLPGEAPPEVRSVRRSIHHLRPNCWPAFLEGLRSPSEETRRDLFYSLATIAWQKRLPEPVWREVYPIITAWHDSWLDSERFEPNEAAVLGEIVLKISAASRGSVADAVADAVAAFDARIGPLSKMLIGTADEVREGLSRLGACHFAGPHLDTEVAAVAVQVEKVPRALSVLVRWLNRSLRDGVNEADTGGYTFTKSNLLLLTAASAERIPGQFLQDSAGLTDFPERLSRAASLHNTFTGRRAALILLSLLRRVSPSAVRALRDGLRDVADVQVAALKSVASYREIDEKHLDLICKDLGHASPAVRHTTGQLLLAVARNVYLEPAVGRSIGQTLARTVLEAERRREVYALERSDIGYVIRHLGRLDQLLHEVLIELSGVADSGQLKREAR